MENKATDTKESKNGSFSADEFFGEEEKTQGSENENQEFEEEFENEFEDVTFWADEFGKTAKQTRMNRKNFATKFWKFKN